MPSTQAKRHSPGRRRHGPVVITSEQVLQPLKLLVREYLGPDNKRSGYLLDQIIRPLAAIKVAALQNIE